MGWTYPTSVFGTGSVLDWTELNDQLREYSLVIDGGVSEHNFDSSVSTDLVAQDRVSDDFAIRCFNDAHEAAAMTAGNPDFLSIPLTEQWYPISESEMTITGPGGELVVTYSFQVIHENFVDDIGPGLQFCIELDGSARTSSLLGSGDIGNERYPSPDGTILCASGAAIYSAYSPHCVEGQFTIDAGSHTVRLLARNPFVPAPGTTTSDQYVGNVEGIAFHVWS